jgi:rhodanese-related sulfurtransferase
VYPTHGAGSFCSAPAGAARNTTIGAERAANPLLAAPGEDAFVKLLLAGLGSYPPYFLRLREVNRLGPAVYGRQPPPLARIDAGQVRTVIDQGAAVVDARPASEFAAGHIPGSLSIPLREAFATWLGWLVHAGRPVVFVLGDGQSRAEVVRQAHKIGHERLAGELAGGLAAWAAAGLPVRQIRLVPAAEAAGTVLDVRQDAEFVAGHLPGALHAELGSLDSAVIAAAGPLTVMCGHGERAMTAASILEAAGHRDLSVALGGPDDWAAASGRPLAAGR